MAGVTRFGGDIATIKNVSNYFDCNKLCSENKDCFIWTYIEGACYVKNENTFWVRNQNVVGGYKDCNSDKRTGQLLIRFLLSFCLIVNLVLWLVVIAVMIFRLYFCWSRPLWG